jgi:membrane-associated phospholipid phosphatase
VAVVYMLAHLPVTAAVLGWVTLRRRAAWPVVRTTFVVAQCLTIAANVAWPCAPPSRVGVADVTATVWGERALDGAHALQSPFAAMPSGHVVFAAVAGGALIWLSPSLWLRAAGLIWPVLVVAVTAASGNHFWLDAVAAFAVTALALALALAPRALSRTTPQGSRINIPRPVSSWR